MHVKYHPSLDHIYIVDFVSTAAMMIYNVKKLNKEGVLLNDFFFKMKIFGNFKLIGVFK